MRLLRACYDWRVITVVAAVGIGIYVAAPRLVASALPLLLLGVCPLSMLLMMRTMGKQDAAEPVAEPALGAVEVRATTLRRESAAITRRRARLTAELEALDGRDRTKASPARKSTNGPDTAIRPERRTRRSSQGPNSM